MFYIYQRRDGQILSGSRSPLLFAETRDMGIIETSQEIPKTEWSSWRILKGQLHKQRTRAGDIRERNREAVARSIAMAKRRFEILTSDEAGIDELREALRMLGARLFPG